MGRLLIGLWFLAIGCWLTTPLQAQDSLSTSGYGLLFDTAAYDALPLLPLYDGRKGEGEAPRQVSLRPWCPQPLDQGATGACTGFAAGYGAMTILEAIRQEAAGPEEVQQLACSPWFLYNQIKASGNNCTAGANTPDALRVLKEQGICRLREFDPGGDCRQQPTPLARASAAARRLADIASLFDVRNSPTGGHKIAAVRQILSGGMPVVADVKVMDSFRNLSAGQDYWSHRPKAENYLGLHALVVIGYDDREQTFELMSSWGTRWAGGGFVRVAYEDFAAICLAAYALVPEGFQPPVLPEVPPALASASPTPKPPALPLKGESKATHAAVGSKLPASKAPAVAISPDDESMVFLQGIFEFMYVGEEGDITTAPVRYDPKTQLYSTLRSTYPLGTQFQLRSTDIPAGKHAYVFSCDPTGKVQLHWPKSDRYASFVPGKHALITIPSAETALQINHPGDDFLCIVYSEDPIPDIRERLARLGGYSSDNFQERLQTTFPGLLAAPERVRCEANKMKAQLTGARKEGTAMGVVLRVRCGG